MSGFDYNIALTGELPFHSNSGDCDSFRHHPLLCEVLLTRSSSLQFSTFFTPYVGHSKTFKDSIIDTASPLLSSFVCSSHAQVFEIPVNVLTKIVRPGRAIPVYTFLFGLVSLATAFVHTYGALLAVRALLGVFECGLLPGIAFYLSRWYRKNEREFCLLVEVPLRRFRRKHATSRL